jgi:uncharacterized protein
VEGYNKGGPVRRSDREIRDQEEIEAIIQRAQVCQVALCDDSVPYVVPVNFGYLHKSLFFHCAPQGKKLDIIRRNNRVCFQIGVDYEISRPEGGPCRCSSRYRSVIGFGTAKEVVGSEEKNKALNIITEHYGYGPSEFPEREMGRVAVVRIDVAELTGKKVGYDT